MKVRSNKIIDVVSYYQSELQEVYPLEEAKAITRLIFSHFFGFPPNELSLHFDEYIGESELLKVHFAFKDLKKMKPIQQVIGRADFFDLNFYVNSNVLIPRPETEELVDWIVTENVNKQSMKILDIGTGSGCIAISLAKKIPQALVSAIDISAEALKVAEQNAVQNKVAVDFKRLDVLSEYIFDKIKTTFDVIVSNPPYVLNKEKQFMRSNVLDFEPSEALFVPDENPLLFYKAISAFAIKRLSKGGKLFFEINEGYAPETISLMESVGFKNISLRQDFFGKNRMLSGVK
ncbi:MAG: peptide chain release factor N(5)-glutamine methyltransferase [Bacteroidales bacterium]